MMAAPDEVVGPVNLGNPVETSVAELARLVIELTGSRSKLVRRPLPIDDPIQRCPDISQAQELLKWQPKTPLRTGLKRTIEYFDGLLTQLGDIRKPAAVAAE
jgi:UDP-glucuronate decarboxylase